MKLIIVPNGEKKICNFFYHDSGVCRAIIGRVLVILQHLLFPYVWHQHLQTIQSAAQRRWKNKEQFDKQITQLQSQFSQTCK